MKSDKVVERTRPTRRPTVSREWVNAFAAGNEINCTKPWTILKVNLFKETKVCCSFFTKLPEFDWPSAKEFHDEDRMWNHPFMQHMRKTMRTPEEVPYCTLCMNSDKRDPKNKALLDKATRDSLEIFRAFQIRQSLHGRIDRVRQPLADWSFRSTDAVTGETIAVRPFALEKDRYRTILKKFGFVGRRAVLLLDASDFGAKRDDLADYPLAPFLAEANERLFISGPGRHFAVTLCRALGMEAGAIDGTNGEKNLSLDDDAVDAIWLRGQSLVGQAVAPFFDMMRRVLRPGGTIHLRRVAGIGSLLKLSSDDHARGDNAWVRVFRPPIDDGRLNYLSRRGLETILRQHGFVIDERYPLFIQTGKAGAERADSLARLSPGDLRARLSTPSFRNELRKDPSIADGVEQFISFSARPR